MSFLNNATSNLRITVLFGGRLLTANKLFYAAAHSLKDISHCFFKTEILLGIFIAGYGFSSHAEDTEASTPFSHNNVIELARDLADKPYEAPQAAPETLTDLDYSTYRQINFQQNSAVWGDTPTPFSVQLFAPGFLYEHLVDIDVVENGKSFPVDINEESFRVPQPGLAATLAEVGKYAGMRLHFPINRSDYSDEFVLFQGASYFRGVSRGQSYGLSARGLAIDVAGQNGEEFPLFKRFWIERPGKDQNAIVVHALLDSQSLAGAYRFGIYPGAPTYMEVKATLFPRRDLEHVGLAPLTSMFMHDTLVPPKTPDYRPAVHDSGALKIKLSNGEQVWRPLNNPDTLQMSVFRDQNPKGFGLIQRQRDFEDYQDLEARYERRPSGWVKPLNNWGAGAVQLIEIPSEAESNDNIVAYWRPAETLIQGQPYEFSYLLSWPNDVPPSNDLARVVRSSSGIKLFTTDQEMVIDFTGLDPEQLDTLDIGATTSQGRILETRIQANPAVDGARVFVSFDPEGADMTELRVQLTKDSRPVAETWLFRWIAESWIP